MKRIYIPTLFIIGALLLSVASCKKKYTMPPEKAAIANSGSITIDSVVNLYGSYYISASAAPTKLYRFNTDANITCTVIADEKSGNIYKTVYVQDGTGTLQVKLINSGGLFVGDLIRINLKGLALDDYGKMIQIDSVDIEKSVSKISTGHAVTPARMTYNELIRLNNFGLLKYQSRLILLDSVEFSPLDKQKLYADPVGKYSLDRTLLDAYGNSIIVRTSGYAKFAGSTIPCGTGSIVAILSQYNSDLQLTVRDFAEIKLAATQCPLLVHSLDNLQGWTNYNETGNVNWTNASYSGRTYAEASNYANGKNSACKTWLISPPVNLSSAASPNLVFTSAYNYTGPPVEVYVSTNYTSGVPSAATWTKLSPALSPGGWLWTSSGKVSLEQYKSAATRVAFVYSGTSSTGSTWEIDDFAILAQ